RCCGAGTKQSLVRTGADVDRNNGGRSHGSLVAEHRTLGGTRAAAHGNARDHGAGDQQPTFFERPAAQPAGDRPIAELLIRRPAPVIARVLAEKRPLPSSSPPFAQDSRSAILWRSLPCGPWVPGSRAKRARPGHARYFVIRGFGVDGVGGAGEIVKLTQVFQPSGRSLPANSL